MSQSGSKWGDEAASSTSVTARVKQMAVILKLHIPALEEIFDYLDICDLLAVGQTCKRLIRVVGYIVRG